MGTWRTEMYCGKGKWYVFKYVLQVKIIREEIQQEKGTYYFLEV